ncbi:class I SAM-dependent methyltransferase [Paenibacillus sp. 32O-W]|nr:MULTISPECIES: methyltransferase [Paenibacillaceae]
MSNSITEVMREKMLFLSKFLRTPKEIGSVTPSSKALARKMVEPVPWETVRNIAELGAGTGAVTKFIRSAKQPACKVLLFEKDDYLREQLAKQYPDFPGYPDASQLLSVMKRERGEQLDCILSGLPFFNFPQAFRDRLIDQIVTSLKPGGLFIAFQYSLQMRDQLDRHFDMVRVKFVPFNIPPAFVYICRKKEISAHEA